MQLGALGAFTLAFAWVAEFTVTPAICSGVRVISLWETLTYDLGHDPSEQENLAGPSAAGYAECIRAYERLLSDGRYRPLQQEADGEAIEEPRPEEIEALQALGYIL